MIDVQFVGVLPLLAGTRLGLDLRLCFAFFLDLLFSLVFRISLFVTLVGVVTSVVRISDGNRCRGDGDLLNVLELEFVVLDAPVVDAFLVIFRFRFELLQLLGKRQLRQ